MLPTEYAMDLVLRDRDAHPDHRHSRTPMVCPASGFFERGFSPITNDTSSYIFANFQIQLHYGDAPAAKTIPTFLALYSFGFIYELVLVYDALRMKNTIQVIGLCACNVGLLIYGAVQVRQIHNAAGVLVDNGATNDRVWGETEPFLIIIPCIVALGTILMTFVAWKLYDEFAWTIYKHISADLRMKRRYLTYQVSSDGTVLRKSSDQHPVDLHRSAQVRFLLLSRIYRTISRRGVGQSRC